MAYVIENGPLPSGPHVLHTCDNPPCCNPRHLFLGSPKINSDDKVAKGRSFHPAREKWLGEKNPLSTLSDDQVREIRQRYELYSTGSNGGASLGREFGVSTAAISYIVRGIVRIEAGGPIQSERDPNACPKGHVYTPENTRINPKGNRVCRTCRREDTRVRRQIARS